MADRKINLRIYGRGEDVPRLLIGAGRIPNDHPAAGVWVFVLDPARHETVVVHEKPGRGDGRTFVSHVKGDSDTPHVPTHKRDEAEAIKLLKRMQSEARKEGPVVTRGAWSARVHFCDRTGKPTLELERRITSYGTLRIRSVDDSWTWSFKREGRWFTKQNEIAATRRAPRLVDAMRTGHGAALGLVNEACGVRDTTRRAAVDKDYAAKHPLRKPAEPKRSPTARLEQKAAKKAAKPPRKPRPPKAPKAPRKPKAPKTPKAPRKPRAKKPRLPKAKAPKKEKSVEERKAFAAKMSAARAERAAKRAATGAPAAPRKPRAKRSKQHFDRGSAAASAPNGPPGGEAAAPAVDPALDAALMQTLSAAMGQAAAASV